MNLITRIRELFAESEVQEQEVDDVMHVDVKANDGRIFRVTDMAVDSTIVEITEEGEIQLEDGEYLLEDGNTLVIEAGIIKQIIEADADAEEPAEKPELQEFYDVMFKDGGVGNVINIKDNEITIGDKLMVKGVSAAVGEYALNSGKTLFVGEEGVIEDVQDTIVEAPVDETPVDETPVDEAPVEEVPESEADIEAILSSIKSLIEQVASLKSDFEAVRKDSEMLRGEVGKFADLPSAESTDTKMNFKSESRDDKLKFFGKK